MVHFFFRGWVSTMQQPLHCCKKTCEKQLDVCAISRVETKLILSVITRTHIPHLYCTTATKCTVRPQGSREITGFEHLISEVPHAIRTALHHLTNISVLDSFRFTG